VAWAVSRVGDRGEALTELALVQLATLAALHRLEQRAASRARAETIDAIVWDLLRADDGARAAAIDRAAELKLDLAGPLRVVLIELGPTPAGLTERSGSALRRIVIREIHALRTSGVHAIAMQGTSIALIVADQAIDDVERYSQRIALRLSEGMDGRRVVAGASSACSAPRALSTAYREAQIALDVAHQVGRSGAVVYDRAGVVGILLSLRHEVGMRRFLELNLGKLLAEEDKQRDMLLKTLRVFFDVNCSHEAASQHLGVHRKTIAHRLARISELTGLDLTTHDDRLVADLSLYVYRLLESPRVREIE
jgi:sugar diacid utilization regulator